MGCNRIALLADPPLNSRRGGNRGDFVAYIGLDVRIRESGRYVGKRKLTKRGESEIRRLLYCASIPARCHARFEQYHQRQLDKGLSKIAANIVLARKLARIAFTLMQNQEMFDRDRNMA